MFPEIHETVKLIANTDIQCRHACNGSRRRKEDRRVNILIEWVIAVNDLVEIDNMEAVAPSRTPFNAINLYGVVGVQM